MRQWYWIGDGYGTDIILSCDRGGIREIGDETQTVKVVD